MAGALSHINGNSMARVIFRRNPSLSPNGTVKATLTSHQVQPYWASINADIEKHLKQAIPMREPVAVSSPMHHLTFAAPRSTAPALCVAACELVGGHRQQAVAAASALHVMHSAFFAHDHIQLSDQSRPMVEHAYSPGIELMIGDAMIPLAFELLATSDDPAHKILRVVREIGHATSTQGMIYGKYIKKDCYNNEMLSDVERLERTCEYYEGVLHACAGACGVILGGGREEEVEKVRRFGHHVGKIQGLQMVKSTEGFGTDLTKLVEEAIMVLKGFDEVKVEAIVAAFT